MKRTSMLVALCAVVLAAALGYFYLGSAAPTGQSPLRSLNTQNVGDFANEFNRAKNQVRVLLMLSPT